MKTKIMTYLGTLLIAAVPITLLWKENASLRAQIAAQTMTAQTTASGESAMPGRRGALVVPQTDVLASYKSKTGSINWLPILEDPDPVRRAGNFYLFVSSMTPESAQAAAESLEDMRNRNMLSDNEWNHFFRGWGGVDGEAALAFLNASLDNSAVRWRNREAALTGWALRDLAGGQEWLKNFISANRSMHKEDPCFAEDLVNTVSQCMRARDPDAASDYLVAQTVAGHVTPTKAVDWIAADWNTTDAHTNAETLLALLPADGSHQEIRTAILRYLVYEHTTKESVEMVTRFQADLDAYAVASLTSHVAGDDSQKAMDWLESLDKVKTENKTKARADVVTAWAARDPNAAGSWLLEARSRGQVAPEITASYAQATVGIDPAAAIAWAQTIPDQVLRHNTLLKMAENRAANSDNEALELLKAAGVTDREIKDVNLLPAIVDRIPPKQNREAIARCTIVRPG